MFWSISNRGRILYLKYVGTRVVGERSLSWQVLESSKVWIVGKIHSKLESFTTQNSSTKIFSTARKPNNRATNLMHLCLAEWVGRGIGKRGIGRRGIGKL